MPRDEQSAETATLLSVIEAFRLAVTASARNVASEAQSLPVRQGSEPLYGIDGLEINLNVGVSRRDDEIELDFDAPPETRSRIQFRVIVPVVQSAQTARFTVTELYDEQAVEGLHRYEAVLTDVDGERAAGQAVTLKAQRADRPGGQVNPVHLVTDVHGTVVFDVDTAGRQVRLFDQAVQTASLPAQNARSWQVWLESDGLDATSPYIKVHRRALRRSS